MASNSHSDSDSEAQTDASLVKDEQWHTQKGVPFVLEGENFTLVVDESEGEEHSFSRTGFREAMCTRCKYPFTIHSYHRRALLAHGVGCAKRQASTDRLAAAAAPVNQQWTGYLLHDYEFHGGGGSSVRLSVRFEKVNSIDDYPYAVKCECGKVLLIPKFNR